MINYLYSCCYSYICFIFLGVDSYAFSVVSSMLYVELLYFGYRSEKEYQKDGGVLYHLRNLPVIADHRTEINWRCIHFGRYCLGKWSMVFMTNRKENIIVENKSGVLTHCCMVGLLLTIKSLVFISEITLCLQYY